MARTKTKIAKVKVQSVTPFLWFEKGCEKAAEFYVAHIQGSRIVSRNAMGCEVEIAGQPLMFLNGGPYYKLTPAFSLFASVKTQAQVDELWQLFTTDGGEESRCGWCVDKFGVSWQVAPERLTQLIGHKDPKIAQAAVGAMMEMGKIVIADLEAAAAAAGKASRGRGSGKASRPAKSNESQRRSG